MLFELSNVVIKLFQIYPNIPTVNVQSWLNVGLPSVTLAQH